MTYIRRATLIAMLVLGAAAPALHAADEPAPAESGATEEAAAPPQAAPASEPAARESTAPVRRKAVSPLDRRIALLAKELDLDARQQAEVRRILLQQRDEMSKAWADESQPAPLRIAASRAIGDRTAERIRAILNAKQREKYIKPRTAIPDAAQPAAKVESWINATGSH